MRSLGNAVKSTALVLLSILVALLLFIAVDVAYTLWSAGDPEPGVYDRQANGWYQLRPGFSGTEQFGNQRYAVYTDRNGYRIGAPDAALKEGARAQTIFLGDSFTYGINGPWDETFVGMYAATADAPVINAGVASYSPTAYLVQYRAALAEGLLLPGHRVVVGVDISDVQDEAAKWTEIDGMPVRQSALRKNALDRWFDRTFPSGLVLWGMVEKGIKVFKPQLSSDTATDVDAAAAAMAGIERSAFTFHDWDALDTWAYAPLGVAGGLARIDTKLSQLADLARENDGEVWLLAYPWPAQLVHESTKLDWPAHLRDLCADIGCAGVIDTFPAFQQLRDTNDDWYEQLFLANDVHYSKAGNAVVYDALHTTLGQ